MRRVYIVAIGIVVGVLLAVSAIADAQPVAHPAQQDANLLRNPSFEGTYIYQDGIPEVRVAPEWRAYWKDSLACLPDWVVPGGSPAGLVKRPEYRYSSLPLDPRRVRSGQKSQIAFVTYGVNLAGVYQQVPGLTGNPVVRAGAWMQSWASAENDPTKNEGGDMFATICIDPRGQADPWARRVQCAEWQWVPPSGSGTTGEFAYVRSPEVRADGGQVTVFILWMGRWAVRHNDVYVDDADLQIVGTTGPTATPYPTYTPRPTYTPYPTYTPGAPGTGVDYERIKSDVATVVATWDRR